MADRTNRIFSALANPLRLEIFLFIVEQSQAVRQTDVLSQSTFAGYDQSTISTYLKELVDADLLEKGPGKRGAYYVPDPGHATDLLEAAAALSEAGARRAIKEANNLSRRLRKARMKHDSPSSDEGIAEGTGEAAAS